MATNFFQRQSDARRSTTWLVGMFLLAVIGIVATVVMLTAVAMQYADLPRIALANEVPTERPTFALPAIAGLITLLLIIGGSLFKIAELTRGGGTRVAESLGGRRLAPDGTDPVERRLLNVVEEMAIASGTPVPPVFLMDQEKGINAFAAGYSPSDAVLGVTRGCAEQLTRSELQGVIAHEFSHILNGDMLMNMRLIGVLNGILLLGLLGQGILRTMAYSGSGRTQRRGDSSGGGQVVLALLTASIVFIVLGFIGTFFGNLIKAAVSRQREYLADASAVQFTRNPSGICECAPQDRRRRPGFTSKRGTRGGGEPHVLCGRCVGRHYRPVGHASPFEKADRRHRSRLGWLVSQTRRGGCGQQRRGRRFRRERGDT